MNREYVMLAKVFDPKKHTVGGWYCSEKLNGFRAFWDGGLSRGILGSEVPYCNTAKDARYNSKILCTGLFTRYGKVIHAPNFFLNQLPKYCLDGELYLGSLDSFQELRSIAAKLPENRSEADWGRIIYNVFDAPKLNVFASVGRINNPNFSKIFDITIWDWCNKRLLESKIPDYKIPDYKLPDYKIPSFVGIFDTVYNGLKRYLPIGKNLKLLKQELLPCGTDECLKVLESKILGSNIEGLMLRNPSSSWNPVRSVELLKYKPFVDSEATVIGYRWGEKTDKGSKLLGLMGSLRVRWKNPTTLRVVDFDLSGFTDEERTFGHRNPNFNIREAGTLQAGQIVSNQLISEGLYSIFPINSIITFRYTGELTTDGYPKEARYWRTYETI